MDIPSNNPNLSSYFQFKHELREISVDKKGLLLSLCGKKGIYLYSLKDSNQKISPIGSLTLKNEAIRDFNGAKIGYSDRLASISSNSLSLWDLQTNQFISKKNCHKSRISSFDWCIYDRHVISTVSNDLNGYISLWDVRSPESVDLIIRWHPYFSTATSVKWNKNNEFYIGTLMNNNQLLLWDIRQVKKPLTTLSSGAKQIDDFEWSYHNNDIITLSKKNQLLLWRLDDFKDSKHDVLMNKDDHYNLIKGNNYDNINGLMKALFTPFDKDGFIVLSHTEPRRHSFNYYYLKSKNLYYIESFDLNDNQYFSSLCSFRQYDNDKYQLITYNKTNSYICIWDVGLNINEKKKKVNKKSMLNYYNYQNEIDPMNKLIRWEDELTITMNWIQKFKKDKIFNIKYDKHERTFDFDILKKDKLSKNLSITTEKSESFIHVNMFFPSMYPFNNVLPIIKVNSNISYHYDNEAVKVMMQSTEDAIINKSKNCMIQSIQSIIEFNDKYHLKSKNIENDNENNDLYMDYMIKPGDTIASISLTFNMTISELKKMNPLLHSIQVGKIIRVKKKFDSSDTHKKKVETMNIQSSNELTTQKRFHTIHSFNHLYKNITFIDNNERIILDDYLPTKKKPSSTRSRNDVSYLDNFNVLLNESSIINESQAKLLSSNLPIYYQWRHWTLLFSTKFDGRNINTFFNKVHHNHKLTILLIKDHNDYIFGGFGTERWKKNASQSYGTGESFLFTIYPKFNVYKWSYRNDYFMMSKNKSLSMGSGNDGKFGLWLDSELYYGNSNPCETYENEKLSKDVDFKCKVVELWRIK